MEVSLVCSILYTFIALSKGCQIVTDPCFLDENVVLPEQENRCPTCGGGTGCDKFIALNTWFRFDYAITTTPLSSTGQCGTNYPIWMNGAFPSMSDGPVDRKTCLLTFTSDCENEYNIMVRNCTWYNVYCMKETPSSCNARFCFESPSLTTTTSTTTTTTATTTPTTTITTATTPTQTSTPSSHNDCSGDKHKQEDDDDNGASGIVTLYVMLTLVLCVIVFSGILIAIIYHFKGKNRTNTSGSVYVHDFNDYQTKDCVINTKAFVQESLKSGNKT